MMHLKLSKATRCSAAAGVLALVAACGGDETQPSEDHTPASYTILADGLPVAAPYTLEEGQSVVVQIVFENEAHENLDDVESSHFAGLTFNPASLATAVRQADHHYRFDVTGGSQGSGTVTVGFGHSEDADEVSFPSEAVNVSGGTPIEP